MRGGKRHVEARTPEDVRAASPAPARKAGQRLPRAGPAPPAPGCPSRAGRRLGVPSPRTLSHPGRRRPRAKSALDSAPRGARPPVHIRRWGRARRSGCRGPESVPPSVGAPRADRCQGPRGSEREGGGTAGPTRGRVGNPGREVFTVGSARRRSSSAGLGLLHYCFRPQRRRPRRRLQPRARPRPLPPMPSREGLWGEARRGAVNRTAARQRGGRGLGFSPPAPTPRSGRGLARDSASPGRISHGSPEPDDSETAPLRGEWIEESVATSPFCVVETTAPLSLIHI